MIEQLRFWLTLLLFPYALHVLWSGYRIRREQKKLEADQKQVKKDQALVNANLILEAAETWAGVFAQFPTGRHIKLCLELNKGYGERRESELHVSIDGIGDFYGSTVSEVLERVQAVLHVYKRDADKEKAA
jgi:hypothetical protein